MYFLYCFFSVKAIVCTNNIPSFFVFFFFPFLLILLSVWLQIEADVYNDTEKGIIMDRKYFSSVRILFTGELFALHAVYGILIGEVRPSAASFNFMFM